MSLRLNSPGAFLYPENMADLISAQTMATWCQVDLTELQADAFATDVRQKVSDYVREVAGRPDWTEQNIPYKVQIIVIWMCRRTYLNPNQEVSESVGPLSSRVLDQAAMAMSMTDAEREVLEGYNASLVEKNAGGIFTVSIIGEDLPRRETIFVGDSSGSDWLIPFLDNDDVGQP